MRARVGDENVVASDVRSCKELSNAGPFVYCDVTEKDGLARIVLENNITHIIHLATLLSAVGERSPQLALRVNTIGIQNVLDLAASNKLTVRTPTACAAGPALHCICHRPAHQLAHRRVISSVRCRHAFLSIFV